MATNRTAVRAICPACNRNYMQELTGEYVGPRRRVRRAESALLALCEDAEQGTGREAWVALILCAKCSERRLPPSLRKTVGQWLREGEVS